MNTVCAFCLFNIYILHNRLAKGIFATTIKTQIAVASKKEIMHTKNRSAGNELNLCFMRMDGGWMEVA